MNNILHFTQNHQVNATKILENEQENIGYYNLPNQDTSYIKEYLQWFEKNNPHVKNIVIIGIGGSSLGIKAIYSFLKYKKSRSKKIYFLDSTDPLFLKKSLEKTDIHTTHFMVISKSGTTMESIAIYKYVYSLIKHVDEKNISRYFTFITDQNSKLEQYANSANMKVVNIQPNIGGRFSVLSTVGLLPLSTAGIDVEKILSGAKDIKNGFFSKEDINQTLQSKALFYAENFNKYSNNCIFAYSERLKYFTDWYVQLWGESLGKKQNSSALNVGLTPIGLVGPKDQHSFLQLIAEGIRDKSVTFVKIEDFSSDLKIPDISLEFLEDLDNINNLEFENIINMQADSIIESLKKSGDIPLDVISIQKIDEYSIGRLMYYYELLTSLVAHFLGINAYNQPGVEDGKRILKDKLGFRDGDK